LYITALPVSAALLVGLREVASEWFTSPVYLGDESGTDPPKTTACDNATETGNAA